jgi:DNA-binding MarR family transcriptional regulator
MARTNRSASTSPAAVEPARARRAGSAAPAQDEFLSLDRQLCFALYSASLAMTKLYRPLLGEFGLTYPQYLVMLALWERDADTVSGLGTRLHLDSGTLTPLLKRLEALGYVSRRRDSDDERRVLITLSPAGQALRSRASAIPRAMLRASGGAPADVAALTATIRDLRERLVALGA